MRCPSISNRSSSVPTFGVIANGSFHAVNAIGWALSFNTNLSVLLLYTATPGPKIHANFCTSFSDKVTLSTWLITILSSLLRNKSLGHTLKAFSLCRLFSGRPERSQIKIRNFIIYFDFQPLQNTLVQQFCLSSS